MDLALKSLILVLYLKVTNMSNIPIPKEVAAELHYLSNATCCVCNKERFSTQIHHIDGNPNNHVLENLALLCVQCHSDAHAHVPFARALSTEAIKKHREEWLKRVQKRRDEADKAASAGIESPLGTAERESFQHSDDPWLVSSYLKRLPNIHRGQKLKAYPMEDHSCAVDLKAGYAEMEEFYITVLTELARFYPPKHFDPFHPETYFQRIARDRFSWHFIIQGPLGDWGTGSPAITYAGQETEAELSTMILEMVCSLVDAYPIGKEINFGKWQAAWNAANA
jgi:hypothetical protein